MKYYSVNTYNIIFGCEWSFRRRQKIALLLLEFCDRRRIEYYKSKDGLLISGAYYFPLDVLLDYRFFDEVM